MQDLETRELLMLITFNEDRKAFRSLYFYYYEAVYRFAKKFIRHEETAEEIVNDAFIKIWNNRKKLYTVNNFKVYLLVCVKNLCIKELEKNNKISIINIDDIEFEPYDDQVQTDTFLLLSEMQQYIHTLTNQLTPQSKLVFELIREEGLKHREVAELLNISVKTVEYHLANALRKIAEGLSALSKK
ncbi:RNA polymerase sigma-70 factor [Sphingobacterium suaedae]|uniref:RNA polymerase sigma-70 factor n=1 Tax=Sphingobacterium suaedae TaxID=1686402 RepID=A0ABW5KFB1_9SPHI